MPRDELLDVILPGGSSSDVDNNTRVRLARARKSLEELRRYISQLNRSGAEWINEIEY